MAQYAPISPASLVPGMPGNDAVWTTLVVNGQRIYSEATDAGYRPVIALGTTAGADDTVLSVAGTTAIEICRVMIPRNSDNRRLLITCLGEIDTGDTGTWEATYGGTTASTNSTATTKTDITIAVTPTGSGHPRECVLKFYGVTASDTARNYAVMFQIEAKAAPTTGMASGYVAPTATMYAANEPVSSERVTRLINGARAIARDRPATAYSLIDALSWSGTRATAAVSATQPTPVAKAVLQLQEGQPRTYRVSMFLAADPGTTPKCVVTIGSNEVVGSANGWTHGTMTLGGSTGLAMEAQLSRTAGSGYAYLKTLQVMRET